MRLKQWELQEIDIQTLIMRDQKNSLSFNSSKPNNWGEKHPIFSPKNKVLKCTGPSPSISQHYGEAKKQAFFRFPKGHNSPASPPSLILESYNNTKIEYQHDMSRADSGRGTVLRSPANLVAVEVRSPQRNEALSRHYKAGGKLGSAPSTSFYNINLEPYGVDMIQ